jgi:hypothetical protein
MKLVERADGLMQYAEALFRDNVPDVRQENHTLVNDRILR